MPVFRYTHIQKDKDTAFAQTLICKKCQVLNLSMPTAEANQHCSPLAKRVHKQIYILYISKARLPKTHFFSCTFWIGQNHGPREENHWEVSH